MWTGWSLNRVCILIIGLGYLLTFAQVTMYHYRQNFRHYAMWLPVIVGPAVAVAATALALLNLTWLEPVTSGLLWLATAGGVVGFAYHFVGVGERVGGYQTTNFLVGPPIILPLIFSALGVLGLVALYWR
ncbi:MAG: hypothetical protein GX058_05555 [Firmicutes bacterium]|nr:hypothetical protein [Bacillota bacterium]